MNTFLSTTPEVTTVSETFVLSSCEEIKLISSTEVFKAHMLFDVDDSTAIEISDTLEFVDGKAIAFVTPTEVLNESGKCTLFKMDVGSGILKLQIFSDSKILFDTTEEEFSTLF